MSLTIVGTVAYDGIETPYGKRDRILGGAGMYAGLAASYFVDKPQLISVIGDDFEEVDYENLQAHGIDMQGVERVPGGKCFFWKGLYHANWNKRDTLLTELNVLADFDPKVPADYANTKYLLLANLSPDVQLKVLERMPQRPKFVMLDTMNFWMDNTPEQLAEIIAKVDILVINDEEAQQLSGKLSLLEASMDILNMGPKYLIIKKGEHGSMLFSADEMFTCPAYPVSEVHDPTGAGDSFAGGFAGYLASKDDISFATLKRAMVYGSIMGAFNVEAFGPEGLYMLEKELINERMKAMENFTRF